VDRQSLTISAISLALVLVGCLGPDPEPTVDPGPPVGAPPNFFESLMSNGGVFTRMTAPPGVVAPNDVLQRLQADGFPPFAPAGARAATPIYGIVTCREASKCPKMGGLLAQPGGSVAVWLVVWPDVSGGNGGQAWAAVDATTGQFIEGDGPPEQ
jgi:hypothetical protein